jgi:hypothetical protein
LERVEIENTGYPKYLGITLDRTLSFKHHCGNARQKTHARNNLIRKLTGTSRGADPNTVRTSALTLCYSTSEYAAPVWTRSCHVKKVDIALNETCRIISGCLEPTPVEEIQALSGIAPPDIRRDIASKIERHKQLNNPRHPLYGKNPLLPRLKSRKSFLSMIQPIKNSPEKERINRWKERTKQFKGIKRRIT